MLQHVVEGEILDEVVGAVDVLVRVGEGGLDHEGGGVAGLGRGRMVGARVAALGLDPGDIAVLFGQTTDVSTLNSDQMDVLYIARQKKRNLPPR